MSVQVVSFHCVLKNKLGRIISSSFNNEVILENQPNQQTLAGLIEGLKDLKSGEKRKVSLRADQAYGYYDPKLVKVLNLEDLDINHKIKIGESVIYSHQGKQKSFRVISILNDKITLDGNHPLAGQDLVFEIEATNSRLATPEELFDADYFTISEVYH